jgi:hypothetical protein
MIRSKNTMWKKREDLHIINHIKTIGLTDLIVIYR